MAYWWASQGTNYEIAIGQGLLWTCPMKNGVVSHDRRSLKKMKLGDIVFHYKGPAIRAVSRVTKEWVESPRPPVGYPKSDDRDNDIGWRVNVTPLYTGLSLSSRRAKELITHGAQGPLDKSGMPLRKYVSALTNDDGQRLIDALTVTIPPFSQTTESVERLPLAIWVGDSTDAQAFGAIRREQQELRAYHLSGREAVPCAICGRELPASFLVAGHIKPRRFCSEVERSDLANVAMLVCVLGCDALFESGNLIVGSDGLVARGIPALTEDLRCVVEKVVGRVCSNFGQGTAKHFAEHARLSLSSTK